MGVSNWLIHSLLGIGSVKTYLKQKWLWYVRNADVYLYIIATGPSHSPTNNCAAEKLLDFSKTNLTFLSLPTLVCFMQKKMHEKAAAA